MRSWRRHPLRASTPSPARDWLKRLQALRSSSTWRTRLRSRTRQFWSSSRRQGATSLPRKRPLASGHHVALSVVGTDRLLASGYFRAKMAQENLIKASKIPYTIVRATQFFEFVGSIAQSATDGQTVRLPPALMQPIVSDDVAAALADVAVEEPLNGTVELAGPEPIRMDELVRRFLSANRDARKVITDVHAGYFGTAGERSKPHPRRQPAHRPDAFRGLAQPLHIAKSCRLLIQSPPGIPDASPQVREK